MKIGVVGTGKLGLMVALCIESKGHEVKGYDVSPLPAQYLAERKIPFHEDGSEELLANTKMEMVSLDELCQWADILFLAPQTPHGKEYEGITRIPEERVDFDYSFLKQCVSDVSARLTKPTVCVVISTVLPGTIEREVKPLLGENFRLVYEPLFIAMGTVKPDFLDPEFVLVGSDEPSDIESFPNAADELAGFYGTIHNKPIFRTGIKEAEAIKVSYNTFITTKTVLANLWGELAHKLGFDVDELFRAWSLATDRLVSTKYLRAGMGDGGGCHPRDNIALSFIARKANVSFDFFDALMKSREKHCEFLADICAQESREIYRPLMILGKAFKPETNIETGSPSILLSNILAERDIPHSICDDFEPFKPAVFFIGTKHEKYKSYKFPSGSTVIDPFRYLDLGGHKGVKYVPIGAGQWQS